MKIAIIGAGLAGTSCAYILKQSGFTPEIYEAGTETAPGASGNPTGLVNPRLSAERNPESDFYASCFALSIGTFNQIQAQSDIGWRKCGGLHLMIDDKKKKRFPQAIVNWGWPEAHMRILDATDASKIAGIKIAHEALYLPDAGFLSPKKLCEFYAQGIPVHLNHSLKSLADIKADAIILACGLGVKNFEEAAWLPIGNVRGQITQVGATPASSKLLCNIGFGGYLNPAEKGVHTLGATFQRWLDHADILPEDDTDNLKNLYEFIPSLQGEYKILGQRAAVRAASKDHFPIVGRLPGHKNVFLSTAHGSHGIITSLGAAHLITDMILGRSLSQSRFSVNALAADRFQW